MCKSRTQSSGLDVSNGHMVSWMFLSVNPCARLSLENQHGQSCDDGRPCDPYQGKDAALPEHLRPGLHERDVLCSRNDPESAAAHPQPVDDDAIVPVHDLQEKQRLEICRPEGTDAVPKANDYVTVTRTQGSPSPSRMGRRSRYNRIPE